MTPDAQNSTTNAVGALLQQFRNMAAVQQASLRNTRGSQNRFDDDDLCFMVNALSYSRIFEIVQKNLQIFSDSTPASAGPSLWRYYVITPGYEVLELQTNAQNRLGYEGKGSKEFPERGLLLFRYQCCVYY
jgi:hypothetical protein